MYQKKVCDNCFAKYKELKKTLIETTVNRSINNYIFEENKKTITKRETTYALYCKNVNVDSNECYNYMKLDKKNEEIVRKNLDLESEKLIKNMIAASLKNEGLYEKWFEKAHEIIRNVILNVSPSISDLKDTLNINEYVKIKKVDYVDNSYSKYINGYALQKNVCSKKMKTKINEPKILLLDECGKNLFNETIDTSKSNKDSETEYLKIILSKIEKVDPNVILVSTNVPYKIQESLSKSERTLIMKVKPSSMRRIARVTKTYILPSTDLVDSQTILGNCKKFYIDKIENKRKKENASYNLMVFENHDSILGCTIIISGPDDLELDKVKKIFRSLITSARDILLQKIFLYFSFYKPIGTVANAPNECEQKIRIVSNNRLNNTFLSDVIPKNHSKYENENSDFYQCFIDGFDTSYPHNQPNFYLVKLTFVLGEQQNNTNEKTSILNDKSISKIKFFNLKI